MTHPAEQIALLKEAIAQLEAHRSILGDAAVETALSVLYRELAEARQQITAFSSWAMEGERRQVTVMFADISGFTPWPRKPTPNWSALC